MIFRAAVTQIIDFKWSGDMKYWFLFGLRYKILISLGFWKGDQGRATAVEGILDPLKAQKTQTITNREYH